MQVSGLFLKGTGTGQQKMELLQMTKEIILYRINQFLTKVGIQTPYKDKDNNTYLIRKILRDSISIMNKDIPREVTAPS